MTLPIVDLCLAVSIDGKINGGTSIPQFTSRYDRHKLFRLRSERDAIMVGANTIRSERLLPLVRDPEMVQARVNRGKTPHPRVVVVSKSLELPWSDPYFDQAEQQVSVLTTGAPAPATAELMARKGIEVICAGEPIDFTLALTRLKRLGVEHVLAEGGGTLVSALLVQKVVSSFYLTIAPVFLGGSGPMLTAGTVLNLPDAEIVSLKREKHEIHVTYRLPRP